MLINIKVKTLDAQTHEFSVDNEVTVREFKDKVAEKTSIAADQQRIIYCGRVMVDDKQLKEYDVDGKVVHVAERPPPSQRLPATDSSTSNANPPNERRNRGRPVNMRNSPLFRALDGMVVGTMAFPMNATTNRQDTVNPFAASSSFCMNRITVARHMLDCANNIAAYLEDPSRGLNNQSLDILARGRWTMESTVVEVGIASDIPQRQQIVEMVQGAVQAALRRSGNTNVTLVQLPTVYSSNENEANSAAAAPTEASANENDGSTADEANPSSVQASVVIEDVIDIIEEDTPPTVEPSDNNSPTTSETLTAAPDNNDNAAAASSTDDGNDNSRRRTGTPVLAGVIEQMRTVQNRLNPFINQYYELLQNETTFEESDTTGRENAQRLFDRVSEAFHYMSHAQHAISDLMLDVSQGTPRYLTCRPILVEQSGYVSSNNFLTTAMLPVPLRQHQQQQQQQQQTRNATNATASSNAAAAAPSAPTAAAATNGSNNVAASNVRSDSISGSSTSSDANNSTVDDPIDDPVIWQPTLNFVNVPSNDNTNTNNTNASNNNSSGAARANPLRVTTATLPTTSTQTRSTARPQVHFGNIPVLGMPSNWNGRVLPSNNVSSFDRFLPCNSHHIREPETASNGTNANASGSATPAPTAPSRNSSSMVGSTMTAAPRSRNNSLSAIRAIREMYDRLEDSTAESAAESTAASTSTLDAVRRIVRSNDGVQQLSIHKQLMNCLKNNIFEGQPINDDTIPPAINRAIQWFGESLLYLPQYEKPEYDSRDSLCNIIRSTLPTVIQLLMKIPVNVSEFGQKIKQICEQLRKRLYSVLYICIGQANAEIFWVQLMRLLCNSVQTNFQGDAVEFLCLYLTPTIPSATDEADAQQFIVLRNAQASNADDMQLTFVSPPNYFHYQPMETDVEMTEAATTSQPEVDDEPLPTVVPGSENWHRHFPNEWLPIITRDIQRQTDNPPEQPPFSDAYISGMSSKRRKLVQSSKAPTEVCSLIADSVKKAIQSPDEMGSTSANSIQGHTPEVVAVAIASDPAVQTSCIDAVRTNVRERLKKDTDFEADKFPKSNKFINK